MTSNRKSDFVSRCRCVFTWRTFLRSFFSIWFETADAFWRGLPTRRTRRRITRWVAIWDQFLI